MLYNCDDNPSHLGNAVLCLPILVMNGSKVVSGTGTKGFGVHTIISSDWGEGSVGKELSVEELTLDP